MVLKQMIKNHYQMIRLLIDEQAKKSQRDPSDIQLVIVSKKQPAESVLIAYEAGCRDFGESRVQEFLEKLPSLPRDIKWHLIGTLQKNKVRKAIGCFSLIHSVDSLELLKKIDECSQEVGGITSVLLEVNASGEMSKHGLSVDEWRNCFYSILDLKAVCVEGLMTIAPLTNDEKIIRSCFRQLRELRDEFAESAKGSSHTMHHLSMGMSHDYLIAIEEGATLLRIGTAIFGGRDGK